MKILLDEINTDFKHEKKNLYLSLLSYCIEHSKKNRDIRLNLDELSLILLIDTIMVKEIIQYMLQRNILIKVKEDYYQLNTNKYSTAPSKPQSTSDKLMPFLPIQWNVNQIELVFEFHMSARKALYVIEWAMAKYQCTTIKIDDGLLSSFLQHFKGLDFTKTSFYNGIRILEGKGILLKVGAANKYLVNNECFSIIMNKE